MSNDQNITVPVSCPPTKEASSSMSPPDTSVENCIPKVIHYCWFGGNPKPALICKCIESWKLHLPDYEIREWNEHNFDVNYCEFTKAAYAAKKWAFVSDAARLKVVYDHGGIYMDTDVEIKSKGLFEQYRKFRAFFFFAANVGINTGVGFGAQKGDALVRALLDTYSNTPFSLKNIHEIICPALNTPVIKKYVPEFISNNSNQYIKQYAFVSENEYWGHAHHYGAFSWRTEEQDKALKYARKNHKISKFRRFLQNEKIFIFFERNQINRIRNFYSFIVYDLFDYGLLYWIARCTFRISYLFKCKKKTRTESQ